MKNTHELHRATLSPDEQRVIELNCQIEEEMRALRMDVDGLTEELPSDVEALSVAERKFLIPLAA